MQNEQHNRGGYGRPPAKWLISDKLEDAERLTFQEISQRTEKSILAVRRLCEKYAGFLYVRHELVNAVSTARVNVKRLRLLHRVLTFDRYLQMQIRRAEDGREHHMPSAFAKLLSASRSAGFRGLEGFEKLPLQRNPQDVAKYRYSILAGLGLSGPNSGV